MKKQSRKKPRPESKQHTGGTRMKELGYKPIQIWVDVEDMLTLKAAADLDGRPMTRLVLRAALQHANRLLAGQALEPARH